MIKSPNRFFGVVHHNSTMPKSPPIYGFNFKSGLKSAVANFTAGPALQAAKALERTGKQNDLAAAEEVFRKLGVELVACKPRSPNLPTADSE